MNAKVEKSKNAEKELADLLLKVKAAQKIYATFTQDQVDRIFRAAAMAANDARIPLARNAVKESGMGIMEDKVIKNHFASETIYNQYKNIKTCGVVEEDSSAGIMKIAEPVGVIGGVIPTTNPTSTAIFKTLIALKTRNAIVISPHPRAKACTVEAARIVYNAAVEAGAPENIIAWVEEPSLELTNLLMNHPAVDIILATGGPGMVKAAYSSGKPALGVGAGNTPVLIDETADIRQAVNSILMSKSFDNGVICASEQAVIAHKEIYAAVKEELKRRGAYLLNAVERDSVASIIIDPKRGSINPAIVGQRAAAIAKMAGFEVPADTKVLVGEVKEIKLEEPWAHEKLSPCLALYKCNDWEEGTDMARQLVELGGMGHTSVIYTLEGNKERINHFGQVLKTGRILVNMPSSHGAIGDLYNFKLAPSLTLGCGSWGGNSVSENVGIKHLMNIKTVAYRRENMLWFQLPPKVYHKFGCLSLALQDLKGSQRAFIVTDNFLAQMGYADKVVDQLKTMGISSLVFDQVKPDPTISTIEQGLAMLEGFAPDIIIGLGGGSPMDAAKIMWLRYEQPEMQFEDMAMRFMDIKKRICSFPELGKKARMVAIPTTSGTGSEVTPFSVVTDDRTGKKYPIADYALTPSMAIIDAELVMNMPPALTAAGGIDAVTHAMEAFVSTVASDYSNGMALESLRILFKYLPAAYRNGAKDKTAREKVHNAATMAGMAFANGFLGICHSLAHKMGAAFHLPHGVANALLISQVIRYNAQDNPPKMAAFPQYEYPQAVERYARIADYLGLKGATAEKKVDALIQALENLKKELDIPASIKAAGVDEKAFMAQVDALSEDAFDDQCTGANPRYPMIEDLKKIYLAAWEGKQE